MFHKIRLTRRPVPRAVPPFLLLTFLTVATVAASSLSRSAEKKPVAIRQTLDPPGSAPLSPRQALITGRVTDSLEFPLPGVNVNVKGTQRGVTTDPEGRFQIAAEKGETLVFSQLGYQPEEVIVTGQARLNVVLQIAFSKLEQVVVVGYGTQRRTDLTGSVSSISAEMLEAAPMGQVSNSLQGLATGLEIVADGGSPAADPTIQIRGTGSINSSNPLVVIDGVPAGSLSDVNPNDIAQIEVLKDASSASIYGTRAANGVILVTTKRGSFNQPTRFSLDLYSGVAQVNNKLDLLNASELVMLKKERYTNDGIAVNPFWNEPYLATNQTDWQEELFEIGHLENVDLSISGGNDKSSYLTSLGYYNEKGIILSSRFKRLSARFNSNHKISPKVTLKQNLQYSYRNFYNPSTSSVYSGVLWQALRFNPAIPVKDADGNWGSASANNELGDINNPIYELSTEDRERTNHSVLASLLLEYDITSELSLHANIGFDGSIYRSRDFLPSVTEQMRRRNDAELNVTNRQTHSLLGEAFMNYNKSLKNHQIGLVAGVSYQQRGGETQYTAKRAFADENLDQIVFDNGSTMYAINGNYIVPEKLASVFGRVNYSFRNKYLLTGTLRADGSSKFASGNRWGYFPGFSVGWRISEEPFMQHISFIQDLKLKGGWGQLGNQEVADLQYLAIIRRNADYGNRYTFGSNTVGGARIVNLANRDITWEKTAMTQIGVNASLWDGAMTLGVTWFDKKTTDMLIPSVSMGAIGRASIPDSNIGEMRNKGWEIEIGYGNRSGNKLRYNLGLNLTLLDNEVSKLYGNNNYIGSVFYGRQSQEISRTYQGMPLASFFGWKTDGLYQNESELSSDDIQPGDVRFVDINGDGLIDENDRTYLGDPNPDMILGLQLGATYKNFSLNANFAGHFGAELFNADRMQGLDPTYSYNMYKEALNRWHGEGTSNEIPRMSTQRANLNHRTSDLFIERGDFVKLKTVTLSYHFGLENKSFINDMTVYIMAENLFTITGYSGYNPEIGYSDGNLQRGVDYANYPFSRKFNLGFKFKF